MSVIFVENATGRIVSRSSNTWESISEMRPPGMTILRHDGEIDFSKDFWNGESIVRRPEAPTNLHVWNWATHSWDSPADEAIAQALNSAKAKQRKRVTDATDAQSDSPIPVLGVLYDADDKARNNIRGVWDRLMAGLGLPEQWVGWMSAANTLHYQSASAEEVLAFLNAMLVAITDRKQSLYAIAWSGKQAIDQCQDAISAKDTADTTIAHLIAV